MKKTYIYFLFGGCPSQLRALRLVEKWRKNKKEGIFVLTGYPSNDPGEVISMLEFLLKAGVPRNKIYIDGSYETLSNVESLEKFLKKNKLNSNQCEIYASTGLLHWLRFKIIFIWYVILGKENFIPINYLPSNEKEVWYAFVVLIPYIVFTPQGWQRITRYLRKKQYESCKNREIEKIAKKYKVRTV